MREIVNGVFQFSHMPRNLINMVVIGETLIDAGIRGSRKPLLKALNGHKINRHVLTHVHPDHQGATHAICETFNIPLWCSEREVDAMETGDYREQIPTNVITRLQHQFWTGAPHPVEKGLREGDLVEDFTVIETPGHSPGHLAFWRERDRVLIAGDVARNIDFLTLRTELGEPPAMFTMNAAQNRASLMKLADLKPRVVLFGHGEPMLDGGRFVEFAQSVHR